MTEVKKLDVHFDRQVDVKYSEEKTGGAPTATELRASRHQLVLELFQREGELDKKLRKLTVNYSVLYQVPNYIVDTSDLKGELSRRGFSSEVLVGYLANKKAQCKHWRKEHMKQGYFVYYWQDQCNCPVDAPFSKLQSMGVAARLRERPNFL